MVIHYRKNKVERVDGHSINHSTGEHLQNSAIFHLNPHGRLGNEELVYAIAGNNEDAEVILNLIEAKVRPIEDDRKLVREKIFVRGML